MIDGLTNADAIPVLERLTQFASGRHRLIVDNIANLETPYYRPRDVSVEQFQQQLGEAIDVRRDEHGNAGGELRLKDSPEVEVFTSGMKLNPQQLGENILFHDQNDRNVERTMQRLAENFMTFRFAVEMMQSRFELISTALRERI